MCQQKAHAVADPADGALATDQGESEQVVGNLVVGQRCVLNQPRRKVGCRCDAPLVHHPTEGVEQLRICLHGIGEAVHDGLAQDVERGDRIVGQAQQMGEHLPHERPGVSGHQVGGAPYRPAVHQCVRPVVDQSAQLPRIEMAEGLRQRTAVPKVLFPVEPEDGGVRTEQR
ncbi:hypothetical protein O1M54_07480 [Streptomyces diastatochromogenes]|nr:hypothetical protein [Streptomyces diastatochromogenes]